MAETNTISGNEVTSFNLPVIVICSLGAVSNLLLLVVFINDPLKCFRNSGTYLVMNLAVSDCLLCLLTSFLHIEQRTSTEYPHPVFQSFMILFTCISFVSITSVSLDRFLIVAFPIKHRILMKGKVLVSWIAAIWIVGCVIPVLQWLSINGHMMDKSRQVPKIFAVIAIMLSAVMYSSTYYKLKKQSRNIALQSSTESRAQEMRIIKEKRFLNTIVIIASIALVCVVPPMLVHWIGNAVRFSPDIRGYMITSRLFYSIFFITFVVNPFIYILRLPNYRKAFYLTYCRGRTVSRWDNSCKTARS